MRQRLFNILNIKLSESKYVFDLLLVQLFIGISNAYTSILAFTLFINKLKIEELPQAYMVIAASLLFLNMIYEKLEHKFSPLQLLKYIIIGSILVFILLWFGLQYGNQHAFIFILLIWSTLFYMVSGYAFWGIVSLLFNVRESRRVFSVIGAGDIPAKLIGYLSTPLLIGFFGLNNLIWFAILTLVTGLYIFNHVIKKEQWDVIRNRSHSHAKENTPITRKDILGFFFKNELIFAISLLSILSYNVYLLVDYTFLSQVKFKFSNVSTLASFIAVFFAVGRFIAVILKLVFTSRVIERLGLISCLFITPAVLFMMCLSFFVIEENSNYNVYMFGLMAMLTEILRSAMQEPVFFILFQPLKEKLRLKGHIISKGYMLPFSLLTVGSTLFVLFRSNIPISINLTVQVLIINILIWVLVIFIIRKAYIATLHASIRKGMFSSDDLYIYDDITSGILVSKLQSGNQPEVIYSLKLLENAEYPGIDNILSSQVQRGMNEVTIYVLDRMQARGTLDPAILRDLFQSAGTDSLRERVFMLLCESDQEFLYEQSMDIHALDFRYRKILLSNLLNQPEFNLLKKATSEMDRLIYSTLPEERIFGIEIIGEMRHLKFTPEMLNLLKDPDTNVRRQAVMAACKLRSSKLLPSILSLLTHPSEKYLALKGLQVYGDDLFVDLQNNYEGIENELVKIAGKIKGIHSTAFLLSLLDHAAMEKDKIIHALWSKDYDNPRKNEKQRLKQLLIDYLDRGVEKVGYYHAIGSSNEQELISRSIFNEVRNDLLTVLRVCSIVYGKKEVNRLIELIDVENRNKIFNAMEMIDVVLPKKVGLDLNLLFDFIIDPVHAKRPPVSMKGAQLYNQVIFSPNNSFNPWTKAICIFTLWKNKDSRIVSRLKEVAIPVNSRILEETRNFVLKSVT